MIFSAVTTILAPLSILILPGLAWLPQWHQQRPLTLWSSIVVTSLALTTLATLLAAAIGLPQIFVLASLTTITTVALVVQRRRLLAIRRWSVVLAPTVVFMLLLLVFSLPYLFVHDGLPTGDIQKSIIWANDILATANLPHYQRSSADFNRDPVDFYTPGLHTVLAYVLAINHSLTTAGVFAIVMALATTGVAAAISQQLWPRLPARSLATITAGLLLTNVRFLRYLREPGYHIQNSVGEFFLFGGIFFSILLLRRWSWSSAFRLALSLLALTFVHQYSMFIAAFALLPFAAAIVLKYYRRHHPAQHLAPSILVLIVISLLGFNLGLHKKFGHIFSTTPHLLDFTPTLSEYFSLMGAVWFTLGLAGAILSLVAVSWRRHPASHVVAFSASSAILLALSQAPHFFIDIPPVRALFYIAVPFSITGAYFLTRAAGVWRSSLLPARVGSVALVITALVGSFSSTSAAYTLSHTVRTNATLLPEQLSLIDHVRSNAASGGVLIDDYNRRSASWLALAGQPMFTRIAADLAQIMAESRQSPQRHQLYLNQLDYEKIFSLGSQPSVVAVMAKHNISFVTGIETSSNDAFSQNPFLAESAAGKDIRLYKVVGDAPPSGHTTWLLRPTTLVNDIGDREDTFRHLPASVRAPRLSDPMVRPALTYRTTTARYIPLQFNVGDYVAVLWDQDRTGQPDVDVELLLIFADIPEQPLILRTATGATYEVPFDNSKVRLPAQEVPFDGAGFVTLTVENTTGQLVSLDMIALGLAHVP